MLSIQVVRRINTVPDLPLKRIVLNDLAPGLFPSAVGGWTIILKEGLYIDPMVIILTKDPNMQIVGLNDVRILFTTRFHQEQEPSSSPRSQPTRKEDPRNAHHIRGTQTPPEDPVTTPIPGKNSGGGATPVPTVQVT